MKPVILAAVIFLTGCAEQSAMRLNADTVRINVSTAPIYGALEPERRVMLLAAQETLKNGYDRFIIVNGQSDYRSNVLGTIPGQASGSYVSGPYGSSGYIQATGPSEIAMPRFEMQVIVKMFREADAGASNAISARQVVAEKG